MSHPGRSRATRQASLARFPQHAIAIANLVATWNTIEDACTMLLPFFTLLEMDQADIMLAHIISSKSKLDAIRAVGQLELSGNSAHRKELKAIFDQLEKRLTARNKYAHALYVTNDKDELCILHRRFEHGTPRNKEVVHLKGLQREVILSLNLGLRLHAFLVVLEAEVPEALRQALKEIRALRLHHRRATSPDR